MKSVLQLLALTFLVIACGGTPEESGTVTVGGGGIPTPPPPVQKAPAAILKDFIGLGMPIACNQNADNCASLGSSLQALEDALTDFQNLPKNSISTINLNDGAPVTYDSAGQVLTFPSQLADGNVENFFSELAQVTRVEALIGIQLSFPNDSFLPATLGAVLSTLTVNRTLLFSYKSQITLIDFAPNQNSFSGGVWTVDRTQLQTQFQATFNVIKPDL